jgi:lipopolysaccharide/colanic/teichoic acid biosynthesis glycosyltransferase
MTRCPSAEAGSFEPGLSQRVTRVGGFLRKTKLDELPQLLNVVRGEMAWVGPRPEVRKWVSEFPEEWRKIHKLKPGITDPAAILFRDEEELLKASSDPEALYRSKILPRKLDMYIKYAESRDIWTDLKVVGQTIVAVVFPSRP